MEKKSFTIEGIQEACDAYQGAEDARYLFVSIDLYKEAIDMCILKKRNAVNLCPMVLDGVAGKVWCVSCEDNSTSAGELFDAETDEERAERLAKVECVETVREPAKMRPAPSRKWGKSMTARQVAVVEEYVEAA